MVPVEIETVREIGEMIGTLLVILGVTVVAALAARFLLEKFVFPIVRKTRSTLDERIFLLLERYFIIFLVVIGLRQAAGVLAPDVALLDDLFFLIYWALGTYLVYRLIAVVSNWYLAEIAPHMKGESDQRVASSLKYLIIIIVSALALILLLDHFDVTSTALTAALAALGVGGLVVGLAAQATLNDIITGFVILLDRPFSVGDRIRIEELDTWGDVVEIGWRSTRVLTRDKRMVAIPNSLVGTELVTNYSVPNTVFRVETDVIVAYGPEIEYVRDLILTAVQKEEWVMKDRPIQALLLEFRESGVMFRVRCWIEDYVDTRISVDSLNTAIYKALNEAGIAMPTSDIMIHLPPGDV